jgi:peptidyl-prolyl cis-trans isomerase C
MSSINEETSAISSAVVLEVADMRIGILSVALLALMLSACSENSGQNSGADTSQRSQRAGGEFSPVIAKVGDVEITKAYFDFRYEMLAPQEKARYSGENWKNRYLDNLVEETLLYQQARKENFHLIGDVELRIDFAIRSILIKAYYDKKFKEDIQPAEALIQEYYDEHPDKFKKLGMVFGYLVRCASKDKIDAAYAELQSGTRFATVAQKYSEDPETKDKGGELGWFNPDGYVGGIGYSKTFTDRAFAMESGTTSEPFELEGSWCILKTSSKSDTEVQPLPEVRERIERTLRPIIAKEEYAVQLRKLRQSAGVQKFGEYQEDEIRTAEQLYKMGSESRTPHAKLHFYETLVEKYPDHEYADDALFMIGFVNSEEFNDLTAAAVAFRRILKEMPESPFADEARWMLRNLGQSNPQLRGGDAPQDPDEAAGRIGQARDGG